MALRNKCECCGDPIGKDAAHAAQCPYEIPMFRQPFVRVDDHLWQGSLALWRAACNVTWVHPPDGPRLHGPDKSHQQFIYPAWPKVDHIVILADAKGDRRYDEWDEDYQLPIWPDNVIWHPIDDDTLNGLYASEWERLLEVLRPLKDSSVMTVCNAGENRSGLASALLLWLRGWEIDKAITYLRSKVKPRYTNSSYVIWNKAFEKQLRERCR